MYPPSLFGQDHIPPGERQVFNGLAEDETIPNWSVIFRQEFAKRKSQEVEIDFLIVAPGLGLLVLEIKSHNYVRRSSGAWYFGRSGEQEKKNPFRQLNDRRHTLHRWLGEQQRDLLDVPVARLLMFPNAVLNPSSREAPDWLETEFADAQDLENAKQSISSICRRALDANLEARAIKPRDSMIEIFPESQAKRIVNLLVPDLVGIETSGIRRAHRTRELQELTDQQYDTLRSVRRNKRVFVDGYAGTGKTTLALQVARELSDEGKKVGLFCFNNLLGLHLAAIAKDDGIHWIGTIDAFARHCLQMRGIASTDSDKKNRISAAMALMDQENPEFDAIVVDEVQDVLRGPSDDASWFDLIDTALLGGIADGTYRLFGDMKNQNFYREDSDRSLAGAAQRLGQPVVLDLRINCRNPRLVGRRAAAVGQLTPGYERFLRPGNTSSLVVLETSDVAPQIDVLAFVLGDLKDQGYSPSEIVVLSMQAGDQSSAAKLEKQSRARYGLSKYFIQEPEDVRVVRYDSIMKFKGLEAPVVIVTDITSLDDQSREILYCGMTRALDKCLVILDKGLKAALVQD